jgi:hypothetical protein
MPEPDQHSIQTIVVSAVVGVAAAWVTTFFKLRAERGADRDKEKEHVTLKILHPLLVASEDFLDRISDINRRRNDPLKSVDMRRWFKEIDERKSGDPERFAFWANDEGYFAMSTLYITALYFYFAGKIRRDLPFFQLAEGDESALLSHLSEVRVAIGGKFGIWEVMQDSLGAYLATKSGAKNYREFCEMIMDAKDAVWFNRLIDFYRDIHMKLDDQLGNIESSLKSLIVFLHTNLKVATLQYCLTEESIAKLDQRPIPKEVVAKLKGLLPQEYLNEVAFIAVLVRCIGQDMTDDYKPSILDCAELRTV